MTRSLSTLFLFPALLILINVLVSAGSVQADTPAETEVRESVFTDPISIASRTKGHDWPRMLGSNYDSRSLEVGVETSWPKNGLRILWTADTGVGYGNGVASGGRWFQFDRFGDKERLDCRNAETGARLWSWQAPVEYRDAYGYNNGPRCSPVVDEDRVYVYGVTGTLACLSVVDGKEIWRRDINEEYNVIQNFFGVGASPLVYQDKLIMMVGGSPKGRNANVANALSDGTAMVALDKRTGIELYRIGKYLASYSAPVIQTIDGKEWCLAFVREGLLAFDPKDGTQESFFPWRAKSIESVNAASPVVWRDRVLVSECYELGTAILAKDPSGDWQAVYRDPESRKEQTVRAHWSTPLLVGDRIFASSGRNGPDTDFRSVDLKSNNEGPGGKQKVSLSVHWQIRNRDRMTGLLVDGHAVLLGEFGGLQIISTAEDRWRVLSEMNLDQIFDPKDGRPLVEAPSWAPPVLSRGLLYVRGATKVVCLELIKE